MGMAAQDEAPSSTTVCISVDFDALSLWLQWGVRGARALSRGEFGGRVGAPRLLAVLERHSVPTTWFTPGHTAETYPEVTAEITKQGHEIANHGYLHESFDKLTPEKIREVLKRSNDALLTITGQLPRGFRHPTGDSTGALFEILLEEGFDYDSSLMADDAYAYWCRGEDTYFEDAPPKFGEPLDLVEVPMSYLMNDFHHFEFNYGEPLLVGHDGPDDVEPIWRAQFEYVTRNCPDGMLMATVHPQCIGQGPRLDMLERFIEYCKATDGVQFSTVGDVATAFRMKAGSDSRTNRAGVKIGT
jgi:peptidoglycan/xylan/chitin deacetylase (PgdA/CDA1 family)